VHKPPEPGSGDSCAYLMMSHVVAIHVHISETTGAEPIGMCICLATVKFAVNLGLNTLPSADNLKRCGKRTSDICIMHLV